MRSSSSFRRLAAALLTAGLAAAARPAAALALKQEPGLELVVLVQRLAGDDELPPPADVERWLAPFAPFKDHPAVVHYRKLMARGFRGDAPAQWMLHLGPLPELRERAEVSDFFTSLAGGQTELEAFKRELADFARDSHFSSKRADWAARDEELERSLHSIFDGRAPEQALAEATGVRTWGDWTLYYSALFPPQDSAAWVVDASTGRPEIGVLVGPDVQRSRPGVVDFRDPPGLAAGAWREAIFSAAYVMMEVCRPKAALPANACTAADRKTGLSRPEDCAEGRWVDAISAAAVRQAFGFEGRREAKALESEAGRDVVKALAAQRKAGRDVVAAAADLLAPLQKDGRKPQCPIFEPKRFAEKLYTRRLSWYLDGALERGPDPALQSERSQLDRALGRPGAQTGSAH